MAVCNQRYRAVINWERKDFIHFTHNSRTNGKKKKWERKRPNQLHVIPPQQQRRSQRSQRRRKKRDDDGNDDTVSGGHSRIGKECPANELPTEIFQTFGSFTTQDNKKCENALLVGLRKCLIDEIGDGGSVLVDEAKNFKRCG